MIDPTNVPDVESHEALARYILHRSHLRPSDGTIKPDAFMPHPYSELSVTRHLLATEGDLWNVGQAVAASQNKRLYGRADFRAVGCIELGLEVQADPITDNPNHANVAGWPPEKPQQKTKAQKIAAIAKYSPTPLAELG